MNASFIGHSYERFIHQSSVWTPHSLAISMSASSAICNLTVTIVSTSTRFFREISSPGGSSSTTTRRLNYPILLIGVFGSWYLLFSIVQSCSTTDSKYWRVSGYSSYFPSPFTQKYIFSLHPCTNNWKSKKKIVHMRKVCQKWRKYFFFFVLKSNAMLCETRKSHRFSSFFCHHFFAWPKWSKNACPEVKAICNLRVRSFDANSTKITFYGHRA